MSTNNFGPETTGEQVAETFAEQIQGKIILTTGVSPGGLGAEFCQIIAAHHPKLLILAGRDITKVETTAKAISTAYPDVQTRALKLDLGSLSQIRKAAKEVNAYPEPINVLVNNAAVMACPYSTTQDGLELQFGTNHIGHFLFTNLIIDKILASGPGARIINVSSDGHGLSPVRFDDFEDFCSGKTYNKWKAYGQSKSANMLFTVSLAEKLAKKGLVSFSLHPGVIWTNLGRSLDLDKDFPELKALQRELGLKAGLKEEITFKTLSQGVATHTAAAFDPSIVAHSGEYLVDGHLASPNEVQPHALDKTNAAKLWELSEKIIGEKFEY